MSLLGRVAPARSSGTTPSRGVRALAWARIASITALGLAVLAQGRSLTSVLLLTAIWSISAIGLSLVLGQAEQPMLCQASFMVVGAYAYGWGCSPSELGLPGWIAVLMACAAGAALAVLVAPVLRVRGYTFAIATIAVALLVEEVLSVGSWLPGGKVGLLDVPPIWGRGTVLKTPETYAFVAAALLGLVLTILQFRFGRGHRSRELATVAVDGGLLAHFGGDPVRTRQRVLILAGALGGIAGALHAGAFGFVQPQSFGLDDSFMLAVAVVIGGRGRLAGAVVGALLFEIASSAFGSDLAVLRPVLLGGVLIATMRWFPEGLLPTRQELGGAFIATRADPSGTSSAREVDLGTQNSSSPRNTPVALETRRVCVSFGSLRVLEDVDVDIHAGTCLGLIGPNGAGKSTLLAVLAGTRPDSGEVLIAGRDVTDRGTADRAAAGVCRTFQQIRLVPQLSVLQNVALGADGAARRLGNCSELERCASSASALRTLGILDHADTPARQLDLTTARLAEMARLIAGRPTMALLDEPSSGLDEPGAARLARAVSHLHQSGCTVVVVEHDLGFVRSVADEVTSLIDGRTGPSGSLDDVLADPEFRQAYLGGS